MKRILVVDDDEFVRSMLRTTLIDAGYDVLDASNGRDALKVFRENPACIVILDIVMPEMEGIEAIQRLRERDPDVKIIAVSGGGSIAIAARVRNEDVVIEVEDTGIGLPTEDTETLFEPFFSTKGRGPGMGLALVHHIVSGHGGSLDLQTLDEGGTRVRIVLENALVGANG